MSVADQTSEQGGNAAAEKWYQVPWVWMVICIPFSAVLFGAVMIISANYQPDDLVVDDYYKEGMGINQLLQQDDVAREVNAEVELTSLNDEGAVLKIHAAGDELTLTLYHVTDRSRDLVISIQSVGNGIYTAQSTELVQRLRSPGIWQLEVSDSENGWRLRDRVETPIKSLRMVAR